MRYSTVAGSDGVRKPKKAAANAPQILELGSS